MQNSTNLSLSTSHVPSSSSSSSNSSSSSLPSSHHTGTVGLTNDALNSIVDRLTQGILPNEVKFRPIPGGRQCAYLPADDIMYVIVVVGFGKPQDNRRGDRQISNVLYIPLSTVLFSLFL